MKTTYRYLTLVSLLVLGAAFPATAQERAGDGALVITAENRTAAAEAARGKPRTDDAIRAGDQIRYTLTFTNPTEGPVRNVVLHNPLAEGLQLVPGTVTTSGSEARVEYSIDGGATYSAQPLHEVVEGGRKVLRPAPAELYTDIRCTIESPIAPGARVIVSYEARLPSEMAAGPNRP